ncbi:unnamed protein product [Symbiodinium sp. KB8]|nr:unnamed protein product [Symbiodinium sp. KB8]
MAPKPQPFGKHDDEDEETDLLRGRWPRNRPKPGKDVEDDLLPFGIKADCRTMAAAVACVLLVGIVLIKVTMFPGASEYERPVDTSRPPTRTTASPAMIDSLPPSLRGQPPIGMSANDLQTTSNPAGAFQQSGQSAAPGSADAALSGPGDGDGDADDGSGEGYGDDKDGDGPTGTVQPADSDASEGLGDEPSTPAAGQAQVGDSGASDGPGDGPSSTTEAVLPGAAEGGDDADGPGAEPATIAPGQQGAVQGGDASNGLVDEPSTTRAAGQQAVDGPGDEPSTTATDQQGAAEGDAVAGPGNEPSAGQQASGNGDSDNPDGEPSPTTPTTAAGQQASAQVGDGGALDSPGEEPSATLAGRQEAGDELSTTAAGQQMAGEQGGVPVGDGDAAVDTTVSSTELAGQQNGDDLSTTAPDQKTDGQQGAGGIEPAQQDSGQEPAQGELSTTAVDQQAAETTTAAALGIGQGVDIPLAKDAVATSSKLSRPESDQKAEETTSAEVQERQPEEPSGGAVTTTGAGTAESSPGAAANPG